MAEQFDLVVIGAGSGGVRAARMAATYGAKVAVVEEYRVGGTCVIRGCVPKKLFVYASRFSDMFEIAGSFGWTVDASFDWPTLVANKDKEIARLEAAYVSNLEKSGVEVIRDRAELTGPNGVRLVKSGRELAARYILVATGGHPNVPDIPGKELGITSNEAFHLETLPHSILIEGGGYIALEFATIFAGLGVHTTIIYRGEQVLRGFDADLRTGVEAGLLDHGIKIIYQTTIKSLQKHGDDTPRVIFGSTGAKEAIMTLSTPQGVYRDTLHLIVGNACDLDSLPGQAIQLDGAGDYLVANQSLNLNSNTVTLMAWVKPNGPQNDWAGLVFCRGGHTTAGMSLRASGNELRYHWDDSGYNFSSGLQLPDNQWSHVAMVVTPDNVRLYLNGVSALSNVAQPAEEFDAPLQIGYDNGSRYFKGLMEEVCVYDRALSQNEIREIMHLARTHTNTNGLRTYYQFNESGALALDRMGVRHASLAGDAQRVPSSCPVGPGFSARLNVTAGGAYTFPQTGLTLTFPAAGTNPNGELCATRIDWTPDKTPLAEALSPAYWVVRNYGINNTFSQLTSLNFNRIGSVPPGTTAGEYKLFKRGSNADGNTWGSAVDVADQIVLGADGSALFSSGNGVNSFSQFIVGKPALALPVELLDFRAFVTDEQAVQLDWATGSEHNTISFTIERSADGSLFSPVGEVSARGPSSTRLDYNYTDKNPLPGRSFYRLRIVDADGAFAYSDIRAVQLNPDAPQIRVSPNPAASGGRLLISTGRSETFRFRLFDEKGRVMRVLRFEGKGELALDGLPAGVYSYQVESDGFMGFGKVVVE